MLVSTLVLGVAPVSGLSESAETAESERARPRGVEIGPISSEDLAEAIRFRKELGLESDFDFVQQLAWSTTQSAVFGLPLTPEEEALLLKRGAIQDDLGPVRAYRDSNRATWGGMWLTYPKGGTLDHAVTLNVAITRGVPVDDSILAKVVPEGADLLIHEAQFSEDDLDKVHENIAKDLGFFRSIGTEFYSADTALSDNSVVITVSRLSSGIETAIRSRFGPGIVRVREGGPAQPDACSRTNCGPPWRAGLKIYRSGGGNYCTSNFVARYYAGVWFNVIWTSGHCLNGTWKLGSSSGATIGTTTNNYFVNNSDSDVQVIPISSSSADDDYLDGTASCAECYQRDVRATQGINGDVVGGMIQNNGAFSGQKRGTITSTNVTFSDLGLTLLRQRRATYTRQSGDSGGPVVALSGGAYDVAAGSHTHFQTIGGTQYAIYSHVAEMEQITGQTVYTTGD